MELIALPSSYYIHQFAADAELPVLQKRGFSALLVAEDEITLVCSESYIDGATKTEGPWAAFKINAVMDFALVGILARISHTLVEANISIFALSTFNTDYILVKMDARDAASLALTHAGYRIISG